MEGDYKETRERQRKETRQEVSLHKGHERGVLVARGPVRSSNSIATKCVCVVVLGSKVFIFIFGVYKFSNLFRIAALTSSHADPSVGSTSSTSAGIFFSFLLPLFAFFFCEQLVAAETPDFTHHLPID